MKQVEKVDVVRNMLLSELERCRDMVHSLQREMDYLPRGSLHVRNKKYKDRIYKYYYRKYWEDGKSVSVHIPESEINEIKSGLKKRKSYESEIKEYKERIKYLEKILRK